MDDYEVLLHPATQQCAEHYISQLSTGGPPGKLLRHALGSVDPGTLDFETLLEGLLQTKKPQIFAESEVCGDGSDWNATELSLLGDISFAVPVTVYDDGRHRTPIVHPEPFTATLLYTPGALLRNDKGHTPADWAEVVINDQLDPSAYYRLYERRLLPVLLHANRDCERNGSKAMVTIPGLGCGQFAGPFAGQLGERLEQSLYRLLETHHQQLPCIEAVYFDPYNECDNARHRIGHLHYLVRPLLKGNESRPQLCLPQQLAEPDDDFSGLRLFSVVAWDHVSWPGNDFYLGARATDDGVKAAATSSMHILTGVEGHYQADTHAYLPPPGYRNWAEVVRKENPKLHSRGRTSVLPLTSC